MRPGRDWTDRVPMIAEAMAALRVKFVALDGEERGVRGLPGFLTPALMVLCSAERRLDPAGWED